MTPPDPGGPGNTAFSIPSPLVASRDDLDVMLRSLSSRTALTLATSPVLGPSRADERAAGRHAARLAFEKAGALELEVLGNHPDGRARWPVGWTGSISHDDEIAVAAVASVESHTAVGIDIERDGALAVRDAELVLIKDELAAARRRPAPDSAVTLVWSAKESAFKAWSTALGGLSGVDPLEIRIDVDWAQQSLLATATGALAAGRPVPPLRGAFAVAGGHVITVLFSPRGGSLRSTP
jgi:4'-phosphopantetheinyl transferase EntD